MKSKKSPIDLFPPLKNLYAIIAMLDQNISLKIKVLMLDNRNFYAIV